MTNRRIAFLIIFTSSLGFSLPSRAFAQTPRQIAEKTFPSVVLLLMEDSHSQPLSLGSGFFVRPDVIATNFHVVEGASNGYVKLVSQETKFGIDGVVAVDIERDLILLHVSGAKAPSLSLGENGGVEVGDAVYVVGNPEGLEGTFSAGIVSGIRKIPQGSLIQVTAPISPGSSGGPVLDGRGEVIGIAEETFREGQNLNFAVPSSELRPLLESTKSLTPLTAVSHAKATSGGDLYGRKGSEGVVAGNFAWDNVLPYKYSFSLRNRLRTPVKDVRYVAIFYDKRGNPIDVKNDCYCGYAIPAGLAKRTSFFPDDTVKDLTARVEIRILNFTVASD